MANKFTSDLRKNMLAVLSILLTCGVALYLLNSGMTDEVGEEYTQQVRPSAELRHRYESFYTGPSVENGASGGSSVINAGGSYSRRSCGATATPSMAVNHNFGTGGGGSMDLAVQTKQGLHAYGGSGSGSGASGGSSSSSSLSSAGGYSGGSILGNSTSSSGGSSGSSVGATESGTRAPARAKASASRVLPRIRSRFGLRDLTAGTTLAEQEEALQEAARASGPKRVGRGDNIGDPGTIVEEDTPVGDGLMLMLLMAVMVMVWKRKTLKKED